MFQFSWFLWFLLHLHSPRDNANRKGNSQTNFQENKTDGIDRFDGLKIGDIEKLEELNNLFIKVVEIFEHKNLTQLYVQLKSSWSRNKERTK